MGRRPKYANLEEAYRGKNARRRERRANASTMDNSGTAATTQFRVSIKESFNSRSTMELRYKGKVSMNTEGINNQDEQYVIATYSHSKGSFISHVSDYRTKEDCAETSVRGMHECVKGMNVESTVLASTSKSSVANYSRDTCSIPIITDSNVLSMPPDKTYQLAQQDATRQRRRKRLAMDPLRIIATEPDILPDIPDCQHVKQRNFI
nr:uncharacterized protein LOC113723732 isoform X1 [Coffea arabica]XP_027102513.1 uncharacterized protein LOC113723737 isoform X1 [Coffea arabica]